MNNEDEILKREIRFHVGMSSRTRDYIPCGFAFVAAIIVFAASGRVQAQAFNSGSTGAESRLRSKLTFLT